MTTDDPIPAETALRCITNFGSGALAGIRPWIARSELNLTLGSRRPAPVHPAFLAATSDLERIACRKGVFQLPIQLKIELTLGPFFLGLFEHADLPHVRHALPA